MRDPVAEILDQRAALDRGAGAAVALSVLLHGGLTAYAIYAATHAAPPRPATMVSIQFASVTPAAPSVRPKKAAKPRIEEPKPRIEEPKPVVEKPADKPPKVVKNTVPLSPFG